MRTTDFSPLYRTAIGFDRMANMLDQLTRVEQVQGGYPPYNIELLDENEYRITMAIAGFTPEELNIETEQNTLKITGKKTRDSEGRKFLHQGIAADPFSSEDALLFLPFSRSPVRRRMRSRISSGSKGLVM